MKFKCPECGKEYIHKSLYKKWGKDKDGNIVSKILYVHSFDRRGIVADSCLVQEAVSK